MARNAARRELLAMIGLRTFSTGVAMVVAVHLSATRVGAQSTVAGHDLTVTVTNVTGQEGKIIIALFTKSDGFPADFKKAAKTATVPVDRPTFTFEDLPTGKYVVVVAHDRNGNGKVEKSVFGPPKEPIGLSNHPKISPPANMPNFEKAKIDVSADVSVRVNLIELGR